MTLAVLMLDSWRCQGEAFQELGKFLPRNYEVPTDSAGFRLTGTPYTVASSAIADFSFDGRPLVYFAPPPGVIRPYESQWQGALSRQQGFSAGYSTSRPEYYPEAK